MKDTLKHILTAGLASAGLCLLLSGCGDKFEAPEAYVIGENSTIPLDSVLLEEEGGVLTDIDPTPKEAAKAKKEKENEEKRAQKEKEKAEKKAQKEKEKAEKKAQKEDADAKDSSPEESAENLSETTGGESEEGTADGASSEGESAVEPREAYTYTYEGVPAAALARYAEALTAEDQGFTAVDMERVPLAELPPFDTEEGGVIFVRGGMEENTIFLLDINWAEGVCTVAVRCPEGELKSGQGSSEEGAETEDASQIMTLVETMDYVRSLRPSDLGLPGESMSEYHLLPVQGSPLVDGAVCRQVNIYQEDPTTATNNFIGSYLIGINKIFRLDPVENTVEQIL